MASKVSGAPPYSRFIASNGKEVWRTSEVYERRRGAERAMTLFVDAVVGQSKPTIIPDQGDGLGAYIWEEATGTRIEVVEVDDRLSTEQERDQALVMLLWLGTELSRRHRPPEHSESEDELDEHGFPCALLW